MTRERACKGCDGSGYVHRPDFFSDMPHTDHAATCWCGATECESCLGTGRVVDHIPVADAVADAETLRAFETPADSWRKSDTSLYLSKAAFYYKGALWGDSSCAVEAARAAFRAVPGLRG